MTIKYGSLKNSAATATSEDCFYLGTIYGIMRQFTLNI